MLDASIAPPSPVSRAAVRFGEIDTLRCLAVIAVAALHARLAPFGWTGVWLFYVISGFVVTTSLMADARAAPGAKFKAFMIRRVARIFPAYLAYVFLGAAVSTWMDGAVDMKALLSMLLFYNNFAMMAGDGSFAHWASGHLWTISVEMQFYLWYGAAFVFLPRRVLIGLLVILLALCPVIRGLTAMVAARESTDALSIAYHIYASSFTQFDAFAAGALLAIGRRARWRFLQPKQMFIAGALILAAYCTLYCAINVVVRGRDGVDIFTDVISGILYGEGREIWVYTAIVAFAVGVVNWTVADGAPWSALARLPLLNRLGEISYGAYLLHAQALAGVHWLLAGAWRLDTEALGGRVVVLAVALVFTFILAELSYRFFEQPVIRAAKRHLRA